MTSWSKYGPLRPGVWLQHCGGTRYFEAPTLAHSLFRLTGAIQGDITDISIDPENKYIASGSNDNIVRVWSLRDFSPIAVLSGHTNAVTAVAFSPSPFPKTRVLLSTSLDGSARLWWVDEMAQHMAQEDRYEGIIRVDC